MQNENLNKHKFQDDNVAIQCAIQTSSLEIMKHFVEDCGADINCKSESGKIALDYAVNVGLIDVV